MGKDSECPVDRICLSAMDIGSDSYALMVLSKEDFEKARELAKVILHRIAVIEEM